MSSFQRVLCTGFNGVSRTLLYFPEQVLREVFHYHPRLTKEQFLTVGYVERKLQMVTDLLVACRDKHHQLSGTQQRGRRRGRASEYSSQRSASKQVKN